jgi:hypothetical protein
MILRATVADVLCDPALMEFMREVRKWVDIKVDIKTPRDGPAGLRVSVFHLFETYTRAVGR